MQRRKVAVAAEARFFQIWLRAQSLSFLKPHYRSKQLFIESRLLSHPFLKIIRPQIRPCHFTSTKRAYCQRQCQWRRVCYDACPWSERLRTSFASTNTRHSCCQYPFPLTPYPPSQTLHTFRSSRCFLSWHSGIQCDSTAHTTILMDRHSKSIRSQEVTRELWTKGA